jgi:glycosyltransferase involved in cell wall biosynthesis
VKVVGVAWRDLAHPSAGGAEVVVDRLLGGLATRGHEVTLVCGGPTGPRGYEVVDAGGTYSHYVRAPWVCLARFRDADVVIDTQNGMPYFSPLWRRRPSVCLVHHVHTDQWQTRFPGPVAAVCRAIERDVMPAVYRRRRFIVTSPSTAEALMEIGVPGESITVIAPGVDVPSGPLAGKSETPLFVSLNRLVPHKRVHLLLQAWALAHGAIGGRLVIIGEGPLLEELRRAASNIPAVEVLGRVDDNVRNDLLAKAWAAVSASHHEGWGLALMEAAVVGTPSLAVDAPGIRDSVVDGVTGVLVRAGSDREIPRLFADAMVEFVAAGDRRRRLGDQAQQRAAEFGWDRFVTGWEAALEEIAGLPGASAGSSSALAVAAPRAGMSHYR